MPKKMTENLYKNYIDFRYIAFFILLLFGLAIHRHVVSAVFVSLIFFSLINPKRAIQALSINFLILLLSHGIYSTPINLGLLRWLVLFSSAIRILPFYTFHAFKYILPLGLFFVVVLSLSFLSSPLIVVSVMKLTVFCVGSSTVLAAYSGFNYAELEQLKKWFFSLTVVVILFSLPTFVLPSIGYMVNGRGFQGIINHPQAFALFLAPITTYLCTVIIFSNEKKGFGVLALAALFLCLLFLAKARTAAVAVFLGLFFAVFLTSAFSGIASFNWAPAKGVVRCLLAAVLVGGVFMASPQFTSAVEGFVFKTSGTSDVEEAFSRSRGAGLVYFWERFKEKPFTGNGFGIDVAYAHGKEVATFMGIPIAAPTEKGFLPAAFLEEVGLVGLFGFVPFIFSLLIGVVRTHRIALIAMFLTCLFVNVGEAVFFSTGYIGGYLWLLIGLCTAGGWQLDNEIRTA